MSQIYDTIPFRSHLNYNQTSNNDNYCNFFPAERVTSNLKELAQQVSPGDIVSTYGIRKAMGITVPLPDVTDNSVDLTDGE